MVEIKKREVFKMPVITMYAPKMSDDQKKEIVKAFAENGGRILGISPEAFNTTIFEIDPKNVGHGTQTLDEFLKNGGK